MSEEKLYAVKNGKGEYWDFEDNLRFNRFELASRPLTSSNDLACRAAFKYHGHVVTFIQEPKKVVLTKEQAEIVENARGNKFPSDYMSSESDDEELLMEAFVNGYTVAKEKKYNVKVPKKWSGDDKHYWTKEQDGTLTWAHLINNDYMTPYQQFTLTEIEHYGLQDWEKEEVTDDEQ